MNKSGLIAEVSARTGASKAETGRVIDGLIAVIRESVAKGQRVSLVGFGTFERRRRNRRIARNPRSPETPIVVPARDVPWFTPGREFKDLVGEREPEYPVRITRLRKTGS
ncbi:MAG: HU family DNA-binding protein [Actinomycetota bacterium]